MFNTCEVCGRLAGGSIRCDAHKATRTARVIVWERGALAATGRVYTGFDSDGAAERAAEYWQRLGFVATVAR